MEHTGMGKARLEAFSGGRDRDRRYHHDPRVKDAGVTNFECASQDCSQLSELSAELSGARHRVGESSQLHACSPRSNARLLWLNMNLLFWMSLVPFVTDFMGKDHNQPFPVALYGLDLACCSVASSLLLPAELVRQISSWS
jgi:hypothetical protein